jgi:hypothetical protein
MRQTVLVVHDEESIGDETLEGLEALFDCLDSCPIVEICNIDHALARALQIQETEWGLKLIVLVPGDEDVVFCQLLGALKLLPDLAHVPTLYMSEDEGEDTCPKCGRGRGGNADYDDDEDYSSSSPPPPKPS